MLPKKTRCLRLMMCRFRHAALALLARATWREKTEYPAHQAWADECEQLLTCLEAEGVLDQFLPRLSNNEWEGALAEARRLSTSSATAWIFTDWQPRAKPQSQAISRFSGTTQEKICVEVKGPGWESELSKETQGEAPASAQSARINAEARAVDPYERVEYTK